MGKGSIPYIFDRTCNLLWHMEEERKRAASKFLKETIPEMRGSIGTTQCLDTWLGKFGYRTEDSDEGSDDDGEWSGEPDDYSDDDDGECYYKNYFNPTSKFEGIQLW